MIWLDVHEVKGERFRVLHTGERTQLATITLSPGQSMVNEDGHGGSDQVVYVVEGRVELGVGEESRELRAGEVAVIPQGTSSRLRGTGRRPATVFCVYGPPAYPAEDRAESGRDASDLPVSHA